MTDRIEVIYKAIDEMFMAHGTERPEIFGGGLWDVEEEIVIWKKQVLEGEKKSMNQKPLTKLQWSIINSYIDTKRSEKN